MCYNKVSYTERCPSGLRSWSWKFASTQVAKTRKILVNTDFSGTPKATKNSISKNISKKIEYPMKMYSMHQRDSSPAAKIPTLCAWQASLSISEWGMRSGFDEQARRAPSSRLRKYDARCCIIFTEGYRSGHNEAVLKTVWAHAHKGSNPFPSATKGL